VRILTTTVLAGLMLIGAFAWAAERSHLAAAEPRVLIPVATHSAATWRYTADKPQADWTKPDFDGGTWSEGKAGFGICTTSQPTAGWAMCRFR
jgi:hypothetical protein